jgi:pyruvate kinase
MTRMILAGMDVARFNLSHGLSSDHLRRLGALRQVLDRLPGAGAGGPRLTEGDPEAGQPRGFLAARRIGVLFDLRGPEIRLGTFVAGAVPLRDGQTFTITTAGIPGTIDRVGVEYQAFPDLVHPGDPILLDDGNLVLEVLEVRGAGRSRVTPAAGAAEVVCRVKVGGVLGDRKKINLPGRRLDGPYLSPKDETDLEMAVSAGADFVAASFTRRAEDIHRVREFLRGRGGCQMIVAKIESQEALENLDSIIEAADALMVARGDLGVEVPAEDVPVIQKDLIARAVAAGKPVITATQMLESMVEHPRPTRAEASDVANAIFDGTDAIMLSAETATGRYPVEAVAIMARIAQRAEKALGLGAPGCGEGRRRPGGVVTGGLGHLWRPAEDAPTGSTSVHGVTAAISLATVTVAQRLGAGAIVATTASGYTARMVARHRPATQIIAVTASETVARQQSLTWGVYSIRVDEAQTTDEMFLRAAVAARRSGLVEPGSVIVITAGAPPGASGTTNLIKVHTLGRVLVRGQGLLPASATGLVRVCRTAAEALAKVEVGDILVAEALDAAYSPAMRRAAAWVVEAGGETSFAAGEARTLGRVAIIGAAEATKLLRDGLVVTLDGARGLVYEGRAVVL